jgi:hypothetical protein
MAQVRDRPEPGAGTKPEIEPVAKSAPGSAPESPTKEPGLPPEPGTGQGTRRTSLTARVTSGVTSGITSRISQRITSRPWAAALMVGLGWAVAVRVIAILVATGSRWMLQQGSRGPHPLGNWLDVWMRWDALNLAQIAKYGYLSGTADPGYPSHQTAFFPGFPFTLRVVGWLVGGDLRVAGLVLTLAASAVAFTMLYRLAEHRWPGSGKLAVPLLACSPPGVFLIAGYTESLFLAGAITAWYLATTRRWWWSALPAGLAVATRTVGVALVAGLAVEYLAQRRFRPSRLRTDVFAVPLALLPLVAWMGWLGLRTGDPLYFTVDQRAGWGRQLTGPLEALRTTLRGTHGNADTTWVFTWRLELVGAVLGLVLLLWCLRRAEWGWAAYTGLTMTAYLLSTWYFSIPRGLLGLFPLPLLLAKALRGRDQVFALLLAGSAALFALGLAVFVRGPWVG